MARDIRIGTAVVGFRADVNQFVRGLQGANRAAARNAMALRRLRRQVRRLQFEFNRAARSLLSFRSAVGLLAGGAGIGLVVSRSAEAGAALFELSVRTGETVENLQTLGRVFEGDGVSAEQFNKLVVNLTKNLGAARQGLTEYARIFEQLGVDVDNVSGVQDLLLQVADAVSSGRVGRDTALYALQTLGGRSGARALNILLQGRDGIIAAQEEFAALGVLTRDQANDLKFLAQTQTNLVNAFQTGVQGLIADNAAGLNEVITRITRSLPQLFERVGNAIAFVVEHARLLLVVLLALAVRAASGSVFGRLAGTAAFAAGAFFRANLGLVAIRDSYARVGAIANFSSRAFVTSGVTGVAAAVRTASAWTTANIALVRTLTLGRAIGITFRASAAVALTAVRALTVGILGLSRLLLQGDLAACADRGHHPLDPAIEQSAPGCRGDRRIIHQPSANADSGGYRQIGGCGGFCRRPDNEHRPDCIQGHCGFFHGDPRRVRRAHIADIRRHHHSICPIRARCAF